MPIYHADRHDDLHPDHWCVRQEVGDGKLKCVPPAPIGQAEAEALAEKLNSQMRHG